MVVSVSAVYHGMMRPTGNWACCHLPDSGVDFLQHIASQGKDQNPKLEYNFYQKCISLHYHKVKKKSEIKWGTTHKRQKGLGKEMTTQSSILAWKIPWTEEPGSYGPCGYKRVRQNLVTEQQ